MDLHADPVAETVAEVLPVSARGDDVARDGVDLLAENHVARLGGELFGRHLLAVEVAGVLLLVALVGSIAIVSRGGSGGGLGDGDARATRRAVS